MRVKGQGVRPRHADDGKKYPEPSGEINEIHAWLCEAELRVPLEEISDQGDHSGQTEERMEQGVRDVKQIGVAKGGDIGAVRHQQQAEDEDNSARAQSTRRGIGHLYNSVPAPDAR